jgi:membrane-associated PAP2 superfamily phosphatase
VVWGSLAALLAARWVSSVRAHVRLAAFSLLLFVVGPWVFVNLIFKEHFGRPRPRHIVEFGGDRDYLPPLVPGREPGASFPAGHPSMGFIWMGYGVYLHASRPRRALGFFALGAVHGGLLGLARIAQGGHFLSDVIWSLIFVLATALLLYYPLGLRPPPPDPADKPDPS